MIAFAAESPNHGPDDLMEIPIGELVRKLASRTKRLRQLERLHAPARIVRRERDLLRIAETAARARVRELSLFTFNLLNG